MRTGTNVDAWMKGLANPRRVFSTALALSVLTLAIGYGFSGGTQAQVLQAVPQERQLPQTKAEVTLSFAPVVKKIAGTVVNVYGSSS